MNTCKTCRFWDTSHWQTRLPFTMKDGICVCEKIHEGWHLPCRSRLYTGPDFGCVHHQEREE